MQQNQGDISIILLAAGSSSRMGQSKQLLPVEGEPLLLKSAKAALASGADNVVVVLGANEKNHEKIIQHLPVTIVNNNDWQKGMGNSLKAGLSRILKSAPDTAAAIIMVCDQPKLTGSHLKNLIQLHIKTKSKIVASSYSNIVGVPALFDKSLFQNLLELEDEQGARRVLINHPDLIRTVDFAGGEIDLDSLADYRAFIQKH
jgi:molybdenum cofactor cytidylyltransferase